MGRVEEIDDEGNATFTTKHEGPADRLRQGEKGP